MHVCTSARTDASMYACMNDMHYVCMYTHQPAIEVFTSVIAGDCHELNFDVRLLTNASIAQCLAHTCTYIRMYVPRYVCAYQSATEALTSVSARGCHELNFDARLTNASIARCLIYAVPLLSCVVF